MSDKFGRPVTSINCGREDFTICAWDDTSTDGVIYLRGDYAADCVICQIDLTAGTVGWARGAWSGRTGLTYGDDRIVNR